MGFMDVPRGSRQLSEPPRASQTCLGYSQTFPGDSQTQLKNFQNLTYYINQEQIFRYYFILNFYQVVRKNYRNTEIAINSGNCVSNLVYPFVAPTCWAQLPFLRRRWTRPTGNWRSAFAERRRSLLKSHQYSKKTNKEKKTYQGSRRVASRAPSVVLLLEPSSLSAVVVVAIHTRSQ